MITGIDVLIVALIIYGTSKLFCNSNNTTHSITYTINEANEIEESNNLNEESNEIPPKYEEIQPPNYDNTLNNI